MEYLNYQERRAKLLEMLRFHFRQGTCLLAYWPLPGSNDSFATVNNWSYACNDDAFIFNKKEIEGQ